MRELSCQEGSESLLVQIDALKVKLPPSEPIKEENKLDFESVRDVFKLQLDSIEFLAPVAMLSQH